MVKAIKITVKAIMIKVNAIRVMVKAIKVMVEAISNKINDKKWPFSIFREGGQNPRWKKIFFLTLPL